MEEKEFKEKLKEKVQKLEINITQKQLEQFWQYMNVLLQWNQKMNLTAIVEPQEIILKHFIDSLTIIKEIKEEQRIIDVGTGAGFPGIPLKIVKPALSLTLMDSLNKRITFLQEVVKTLKLENIELIHARAEELARTKEHREQYDIAVSRAVAPLNVLLEYLVPFLKVGGEAICMKAASIEKETEEGNKALEVLNCEIKEKKEFYLVDTDIQRTILVIEKKKQTKECYPRKAGTPKTKPII